MDDYRRTLEIPIRNIKSIQLSNLEKLPFVLVMDENGYIRSQRLGSEDQGAHSEVFRLEIDMSPSEIDLPMVLKLFENVAVNDAELKYEFDATVRAMRSVDVAPFVFQVLVTLQNGETMRGILMTEFKGLMLYNMNDLSDQEVLKIFRHLAKTIDKQSLAKIFNLDLSDRNIIVDKERLSTPSQGKIEDVAIIDYGQSMYLEGSELVFAPSIAGVGNVLLANPELFCPLTFYIKNENGEINQDLDLYKYIVLYKVLLLFLKYLKLPSLLKANKEASTNSYKEMLDNAKLGHWMGLAEFQRNADSNQSSVSGVNLVNLYNYLFLLYTLIFSSYATENELDREYSKSILKATVPDSFTMVKKITDIILGTDVRATTEIVF